ncbi:hypothetical protein, partial [Bacillus cereus]|uniref:hypothetical protein n=2 Tax=Bacillus cereus TaxID=1396 RepID=UPI0034D40787
YNKNIMVILLFTPCAEDKIVFPDLIFLFLDFRYKKGILNGVTPVFWKKHAKQKISYPFGQLIYIIIVIGSYFSSINRRSSSVS